MSTAISAYCPDFFLIGSARSGTTALSHYLRQHPQLFVSDPKEPHYFAFCHEDLTFTGPGDDFFNRSVVQNEQDYRQLFRRRTDQLTGDASVSYLYYSHSLQRIKAANPNAKLLCVLRHPVDRAYSAFMYLRSRMLETHTDFELALQDEADGVRANWHHLWHYRGMSRYGPQLQAVFDHFDQDQIRVFLYEEFCSTPLQVLRDCFEFLEVDQEYLPVHRPASLVSGIPRSKVLQLFLQSERLKSALRPMLPSVLRNRIRSRATGMNVVHQNIDRKLRACLTPEFHDDIAVLEHFVQRDLSVWRSH